MASTPFRFQADQGLTLTAYLVSLGGTGTPNVSGYSPGAGTGGWYSITITEALVGKFYYYVNDSNGNTVANGLADLLDTTDTFFGFDPIGPTGFESTPTAASIRSAVGLASANLDTQLSTIDGNVDGVKSKTDQLTFTTANQVDANALSLDAIDVRAAVGLASANLDTQLSTIDSEVGQIKAKTDQLTFTVTNQVDANALTVSGAQVRSAIGLASANLDTQLALIDGGITDIIDDVTTLDSLVDAIKAKTDQFVFTTAGQVDATAINALDAAGIRAAVGLASANLDTQLSTIDTNVDVIKAKTDQFVFTTPGQVDANALSGGGGLDAAGIRAAVGLASANLDTQLSTIDTVVDAVKVVTDQFVFTVSGQVDANALSGGGGLDAAGIRAAVGLASANLDTQLSTIDTNVDLARDQATIAASNTQT